MRRPKPWASRSAPCSACGPMLAVGCSNTVPAARLLQKMPGKAQDDDLVMNLVDLALAKPPEERESFLREACSGEPELFHQTWEYVEWEHRMQGFLREPLFQLPQDHIFKEGELLDGRFRIEREIAQGGMRIVSEAWDHHLTTPLATHLSHTSFPTTLPPAHAP